MRAGVGFLMLSGLVWCNTSPRVPEASSPWFDLDAVRELAGEQGLPERLDAVEVVASSAPRFFLTGALSLDTVRTPGMVYRVSWPTRSGVVDGANDADHQITPWATFDDEGWAQAQLAMQEAAWIVVTHEHEDHLSGVLTSPVFEELADLSLIHI